MWEMIWLFFVAFVVLTEASSSCAITQTHSNRSMQQDSLLLITRNIACTLHISQKVNILFATLLKLSASRKLALFYAALSFLLFCLVITLSLFIGANFPDRRRVIKAFIIILYRVGKLISVHVH